MANDGTTGNDSIRGDQETSPKDYIDGGAGNDTISGLTENDSLSGAAGDDSISGDSGNDVIVGGAGKDTLLGGASNDVIMGDNYVAISSANTGNHSKLLPNYGSTSAYSSSPANPVTYTFGHDSQGGPVTVYYIQPDGTLTQPVAIVAGNARSITVPAGAKLAVVQGDVLKGVVDTSTLPSGTSTDITRFYDPKIGETAAGGADSINAGDGDDVAYGETGNDTMDMGTGADRAFGGIGDDSMQGGDGNDTMQGGAGNDTLYGDNGTTAATSDDALSGGDGNDVIYGGVGQDAVSGGAGNDTLDGGAGNDTVSGGGGSDSIIGGDGNDVIRGDGLDALPLRTGTTQTVEGILTSAAGSSTAYGGGPGATQNAGEYAVTFTNNSGVFQTVYYVNPDGTLVSDTMGIPPTGNNVRTFYFANGTNVVLVNRDTGEITGYYKSVVSNNAGSAVELKVGGNNDALQFAPAGAADTIDGGAGADSIQGMDGDDSILGGDGDDTIDGGVGSDTISGGNNNDYITGDNVNSTLPGGNDVLSGDSGNDTILGLAGNDSISGDAGDDSLLGGTGNDTIDGGSNNDTILGEAGDDSLSGGLGNDSVSGGDGADQLFGSSGFDTISGDAGNDTIDGGNNNDRIDGGAGDDSIYGGNDGGFDTILGGDGRDYIDGGGGADVLTGGEGFDTFKAGDGDTITDFNTAASSDIQDGNQSNNDFIDLSGYYNRANLAAYNAYAETMNLDTYGNPLQWLQADQQDDGLLDDMANLTGVPGFSMKITNVSGQNLTYDNTNVTCFARGTMILTEDGETAVEDLAVGDMVVTRDRGPQPIVWIGSKKLSADMLDENRNLRPIRIRADALAPGYPARDLLVSPQHRILLRSRIAQKMFGENEVLVAAKQLLSADGIDIVESGEVEYFHFLFDRHEIVIANGAEAESLFTGPEALKAVSEDARVEILTLFPELEHAECHALSSRQIPSGRMSRKLVFRHLKNRKPLFSPANP
ncbi:Hint domain-containing protein [Paracoccus aurantiacus]|uniref:Hint domain-containing protein n=1 Tax=Paracoccus aurantiacus TaxID=2599412 RepID=UPI00363A79D7